MGGWEGQAYMQYGKYKYNVQWVCGLGGVGSQLVDCGDVIDCASEC